MLAIHNAIIHTQNPARPITSAIAIEYGQVIATGTDEEILTSFSPSQTINARGRTVIPGLTDAHMHLEEFAFSLQKVNCETPTLEECLERVSEQVKRTPAGEWVLGHGWNQNNWSEGYGNATLLDHIAPLNPVYLTHKSLHSAWASSLALQLASITPETPDPPGGRISRLPSGKPDGILFESATNLLEQAIPKPTLGGTIQAIGSCIPGLWRMGLTGIHDFDGSRCFSALQVLHQRAELKMRVLKAIHLEDLMHAVEMGLRSGFGDDALKIGPLKLFSDGALGPQTAAMLAPYNDDQSNNGILMMDADAIFEQGRIAAENGISLAVHAIGDLANREVLRGYAMLREFERKNQGTNQKPLRHRIEHVQVIDPADIPQFAELQITASMQPIHATSDMWMADHFWGQRSAFAYAWRSLVSMGICLAFGSDAPVESPNPFYGMHAAVTRQRADGAPSAQGWYPEQRLSIDEALLAYTSGPAYAAGMEERLGKLMPGYLADLLILNIDPFTCTPQDLVNVRPVATMVGGELVFSELD